jgi:hypothetical protein
MGGQPPVAGAVVLALIPGKLLVHRVERTDPELNGPPNRARLIGTIKQDNEPADNGRRLPTRTELANQSSGRPLDPGDRQLGQLSRHLLTMAERDHVVIVVVEAAASR